MKSMKFKLITCLTLMVTALTVNATEYSNIYVFGDSLSDNGNLKALNPSVPERFTNGPVAVEVVANGLGMTLTPSKHLLGGLTGNNYAIAGAKAVDDDNNEATPDINLPTQVNAFLQIHGGSAPADALYIVLIGGNDIRAARQIRSDAIFASGATERAAINAATKSIADSVAAQSAQIRKLLNAGARHILVSNAPDIGIIPETTLLTAGLVAQAPTSKLKKKAGTLPAITTALSKLYNAKLALNLYYIELFNGVNLMEYNLIKFTETQIKNAASNGYTNVKEPCIYVFSQGGTPNPGCIASAPSFPTQITYFFWDEIHPSAVPHYRTGLDLLRVISRY